MVLWMIYTEISFPHVMNEAQNDTHSPNMMDFRKCFFSDDCFIVRWKFRVVAELNFMQIKKRGCALSPFSVSGCLSVFHMMKHWRFIFSVDKIFFYWVNNYTCTIIHIMNNNNDDDDIVYWLYITIY